MPEISRFLVIYFVVLWHFSRLWDGAVLRAL